MNVKRLSLASLFLVMACVCSFANTFVKVTKKSQLVPGNRYLLICEEHKKGMYAAFSVKGKKGITSAKESEGHFTVQKSNEGSYTMLLISSDINSENKPVAYTLGTGTNENEYTLYDTSCNKYIGLDGNVTYNDGEKIWTIEEANLTFSNNLNYEDGLFLLSQNGQYVNFRGDGNPGTPQFTTSTEEFPMALYVETTKGDDFGQTMITFKRSRDGGDYYATAYYENNDFLLDNEITAWGLKNSLSAAIPAGTTTTIDLEQIVSENEVIYAGTPVILTVAFDDVPEDLQEEEVIEYPIHLFVEGTEGKAVDTHLVGTEEGTTAPDYSFGLSRKNGVIGFYIADGATIPAHKAYIQAPAPTSIKQFIFNLNGETAIQEINTPQEFNNGAIYNLAGQQVNKNYRGIVLKNGKKFLK